MSWAFYNFPKLFILESISASPTPNGTISQKPKSDKISARRAQILELAAKTKPTLGSGYLELNPKLSKLQEKVVRHTAKRISPTKKKTKIIELIKDAEGEIVDVKETKIECAVAPPEEEPIFEIINQT